MFKVFWVSEIDEKKKSSWHEHEWGHTDHHVAVEQEIDVEIREWRDHETDIGQIALDILDCPNSIIIVAPVAWVDPSDVDIGLSRNILTLSWNRTQAPIYLDAKRMMVEECFYGAFSRSVILPENLGFDKIKATIEHNVIMIEIPKLTLISKTIKIGS
jgi:HSP20 family molecular chaperone IbpA